MLDRFLIVQLFQLRIRVFFLVVTFYTRFESFFVYSPLRVVVCAFSGYFDPAFFRVLFSPHRCHFNRVLV